MQWRTVFIFLAVALSIQFAVAPSVLLNAQTVRTYPIPIVIDYDGGGAVNTYVEWYKRLKESRTPVVLRGICISACAFVLMLPKDQVCVEPTASLAFHLATDSDGPDEAYTQALIRRYYPTTVQKWLEGRILKENREEYMTAAEMVKLGVFPACK